MIKRVIAFFCYTCMLCFLISLQSCDEDENTEKELLQFPSLETLMNEKNVIPIIAHRGCWSGDSFPQNSIAAFQKALQLPILGTEFDVRQTIDKKLVLNHGTQFDSLYIYKTSYTDLCSRHLPNGETIPLLEDFVRAYCSVYTNVLMIVDLKSCVVGDVLKLLKQYDVLSHVLFVSFSKKYCDDLVRRGYGPITYYLGGDMTPEEVSRKGYGGINYSHTVFKEHPEWVEEAKGLGLEVGVWTVNNDELIEGYLADSVMVTTDRADKYGSFINSDK